MGKWLGDYTEARTLFAFMFYATFCWLILKHVQIPPELNTIVSSLMGYWFGAKTGAKTSVDIDSEDPKKKISMTSGQAVTDYLLVVCMVFMVGCAITRQSHYYLSGNNIKTPYGTGDVIVQIDANTTIGVVNGTK